MNKIWDNQSSVLVGDYLLSRCFEMMVEDGDLEVLKLLSSTSAKIAQGEVLQLQHKSEIDMLEEIYLKIVSYNFLTKFHSKHTGIEFLSNLKSKSSRDLKNILETSPKF